MYWPNSAVNPDALQAGPRLQGVGYVERYREKEGEKGRTNLSLSHKDTMGMKMMGFDSRLRSSTAQGAFNVGYRLTKPSHFSSSGGRRVNRHDGLGNNLLGPRTVTFC